MLHHHNFKFGELLYDAYPDIGLRKEHFVTRNKWAVTENLRGFFRELAAQRGFDPLDPLSWQSLSSKDIKWKKGAGSILNIFGSYPKMIESVFPDIGFDKKAWSMLH